MRWLNVRARNRAIAAEQQRLNYRARVSWRLLWNRLHPKEAAELAAENMRRLRVEAYLGMAVMRPTSAVIITSVA